MREWQSSLRVRLGLTDVSRRTLVFVSALWVATTVTVGGLVADGESVRQYSAVTGLVLVAAYGERGRIALRGRLWISISLLPAVFAAVLFGPLAAMVVFGGSAIGLSIPVIGRVTFAAGRALIGALAAGAAAGAYSLTPGGTGGIVAAAAAAASTAAIADAALTSVTWVLRGRGAWVVAFTDVISINLASVPIYSSAVALLALAYRDISAWTLPLFFAPAVAAQRWFLMYQEQRRLTEDLRVANARLESANLSFANGLVATLDARDRYTAGHSAAVAIYARDIAARMGLDEAMQDLAHLCGLVHDIGKIGLPAGLLEKPGALTLEERREMQRHSEIGERILANVDTYADIAPIVRHHHERVDGQGYPDGLRGEAIPTLSRIIAVADAYNAMTSDRPYRDAMPSRVARLRLAQAVEAQFDTAVVAAFEALLAGAPEDYRLGRGQAFRLGAGSSMDERPPVLAAASA
jgi:putative nucleotidyltransferase with HDIG domain